MKNYIPLCLVLIGLIVGVCVFSVYPPKTKIRLGKDLQGGVSLVYAVKVADDSDPDEVLGQTIDVLKQRVNPQGILDIAMQPVGRDRIEVVMPLPNDDVRALQQTYRDSLDALLGPHLSLAAVTGSGTEAVRRFWEIALFFVGVKK